MKKELTTEQKERRAQTLVTILLPSFFLLIIGTMVIAYLQYSDRDKAANLASQYTVSGEIEKVILKKVESTSPFQFDTEEYYILVNNKKYKLPYSFTDDVRKGSEVTLVGDQNGVSTIEIEQ